MGLSFHETKQNWTEQLLNSFLASMCACIIMQTELAKGQDFFATTKANHPPCPLVSCILFNEDKYESKNVPETCNELKMSALQARQSRVRISSHCMVISFGDQWWGGKYKTHRQVKVLLL